MIMDSSTFSLTSSTTCTDREDGSRPTKRRKMSSFDSNLSKPRVINRATNESPKRRPLGHVTENRTRLEETLQSIPPGSFYGKDSSVKPASIIKHYRNSSQLVRRISSLLPTNPADFKRTMRIEVTNIDLREGEDLQNFMKQQETVETDCRCTLALFARDPNVADLVPIEVYKKSERCILKTSYINGELRRELLQLNHFLITSEDMYLNRLEHGPMGNSHLTFEMADHYTVQVRIEPLGAQKSWPPFDIQIGYPNIIPLYGQIRNILDHKGQTFSAHLSLLHGKEKRQIPYDLKMKIEWSLPSHLHTTRIPELVPTLKSSSKKPDVPDVPKSPSTTLVDGGLGDSPSRTQRRRPDVPTYNLKALSAVQQGREPNLLKLSKRGHHNIAEASSETMVTYNFSKGDNANDHDCVSETKICGLKCPFCGCKLCSLDTLRLHLCNNHTRFRFELISDNPPRFSIVLDKSHSISLTDPRIFQLRKPQTLFNLEKFLNGDDIWVKTRLYGQLPENFDQLPSSSSSLYDSRSSSLNPPNATEDVVGGSKDSSAPVAKRRKVRVPRVKHNKPLYDAITQRLLVPGEDLPASDDERDEDWIHQKDRDIILDFTDLTPEEEDYILRWNPFATAAHLSSVKALPQTLKRFVETNESWFLKQPSRKMEFGKQLETFVMRRVITTEEHTELLDILRRAEKKPQNSNHAEIIIEEQAVLSASPKSTIHCHCGKTVTLAERAICRGPVRFLCEYL